MLLYDFKCSHCGAIEEHFSPVDQRVRGHDCGGIMHRLISSRFGIVRSLDFVTDNITGEPARITNKAQHQRLCRAHGVAPKFGKGWW